MAKITNKIIIKVESKSLKALQKVIKDMAKNHKEGKLLVKQLGQAIKNIKLVKKQK